MGLEAAKEITEAGLTLEEYVGAKPVSEGLAELEAQEKEKEQSSYLSGSTEEDTYHTYESNALGQTEGV